MGREKTGGARHNSPYCTPCAPYVRNAHNGSPEHRAGSHKPGMVMAKSYETPRLTALGTVTERTAFSGSSARTDYFENADGSLEEVATGSRDNCLSGSLVTTSPNPSDCH